MRDLRLYYQLQVNEVASRLHIRAKYIQAIEDGAPELMPGKVYARGYIANYAEFLGLDGEAIAMEYLGEEAISKEQPYFTPDVKASKKPKANFWLTWIVVAGMVCFGGALLLRPSHNNEVVVEQVPEHLVKSIRDGLMPTPQNAPCLNGAFGLACVQHAIRLMPHFALQVEESVPLQWKKATPGKIAPSNHKAAQTQDTLADEIKTDQVKENETSKVETKKVETKESEVKAVGSNLDEQKSLPLNPAAHVGKPGESEAKAESDDIAAPVENPPHDDEEVKLRDPNAPIEIEIPRRRR